MQKSKTPTILITKISVVDVRDIAAVAAAVLTEDGHVGKTYNITGAEVLLHGEIAEKMSTAFNRSILCVDVSPESMREGFRSIGLPVWQADGVIEDYAHYSRGEAAETASGIREAIGGVPCSFDYFARDYALAFS